MRRILITLCVLSFMATAFRPALPVSVKPVSVAEPVKLSWETLRDVTFKKKWYATESIYMLYPTFGPGIQKLNGKVVELTGYVLPVDLEENT